MSIAEKALEALRGGLQGIEAGPRKTSHKDPRKDFEATFKLALEEVNGKYISGTISYIKGTHPGLWERIVKAEERISEAWLRGTEPEFRKNLGEWTNLNFRAIEIFEVRDAQRTLFEHKGKIGNQFPGEVNLTKF